MNTDDIEQEVISFGCRLNTYEGEVIKNNLAQSGMNNVLIFNTCAVTKTAEQEAKSAIRKAKRLNPDKIIIVTGCAAQINPDAFAQMKEVTKVIGNKEKLLPEYYSHNGPRIAVENSSTLSHDTVLFDAIKKIEGRARAFVQVQNGCDHRCTFCIIPFSRGKSRSMPMGVIVNQIGTLIENGYNEIVLTGVDLTAYGNDLPGKPSLGQMIRRLLAQLPMLKRLRLSSIDVAEIDDGLFDVMAKEPRLMPHFHLSLQSGDDIILKRMNRRHNRQQVLDFCHKLRQYRPEVSFGADIITGFPTETDEMFENTKSLIAEAGLQYLHIFPYSERDGTPASKMPKVPVNIRKARAAVLRAEGTRQLNRFMERHIGTEAEVIVESNNTGHTQNFIPVKLIFEPMIIGAIVKVKLIAIEGNKMIARELNR